MGKHIEDIHAFPLAGKQEGSASPVSPCWDGGLVFLQNQPVVLPREGSGGLGAKCGVFAPCAAPCGCEHVLVLVLELSMLLAQAGEIPLAEPEMTLDGFSRE